MVLFGIPNCNTVKKAIDWLQANEVDFEFHNYKKHGIDSATLKNWCGQVGWEILVNKKGTTWRALPQDVQATITNQKNAIALMLENTSLIKRPVIENDGKISAIGFNEEKYEAAFL